MSPHKKALEDLRLQGSDPGSQAKYDASLCWLKTVEKRFDDATVFIKSPAAEGNAPPTRLKRRMTRVPPKRLHPTAAVPVVGGRG